MKFHTQHKFLYCSTQAGILMAVNDHFIHLFLYDSFVN